MSVQTYVTSTGRAIQLVPFAEITDQLRAELTTLTYPEGGMRGALADPQTDGLALLIVVGGAVQAWAALFKSPRFSETTEVHCFVREDNRQSGLGGALMEAINKAATAYVVMPSDEAGLRFYVRHAQKESIRAEAINPARADILQAASRCVDQHPELFHRSAPALIAERLHVVEAVQASLVAAHTEALHAVYKERGQVVLALARLAQAQGWTVGRMVDAEAPDWPVLMIDTPEGQISWHFKTDELPLDLPLYDGVWDGHDTEEKYRRLAAAQAHLG
jgi:hypothetical protein